MAADQGVQPVNGRDTRLNELIGVVAGGGIHGQTVDIPILVGQDGWAAVNRLPHAVEHPAQHISGHPQLKRVSQEPDFGVRQIDTG